MASRSSPQRDAPGSVAPPPPGAVLGHVTLLTGKQEYLSERTVAAVRTAVREHDPEAELSDTVGGELSAGSMGELAAPSLFSATRCVVVRELENLPEDSVAGLLDYAAAPVEDVALVLVHSGGPKGSGVLTKLRKLPAVTEVKAADLRPSDYPCFVAAEARSHGARLDQAAARLLVQAVGQDLRSLAAAAHQLAHDFPGEALDVDRVGQYFGGRAEARSFDVADAALSGRRLEAMVELRWALENGGSAAGMTAAFAGGVRALAKFRGAVGPSGRVANENALAQEIGVPPWKVRSVKAQAQGWDDDALVAAVRAVAQADADVKGAASDPAYTLERLVLTITALRG